MNPGMAMIGGAGIGAATMFLLDPDRGRRRRALMQDQAVKAGHRISEAADATTRDVRNRSFGLFREIESWFAERPVDEADQAVMSRVRSNLGMLVRHPRSIDVSVTRGTVTLEGPILQDEVDQMRRMISRIPGVRHVDDRLEVHEQADGIPGLQGSSHLPPRRRKFEFMQANLSPAARMSAAIAGGVLAAIGLRSRSVAGIGMAAVGASLLTRGLTNREFSRFFQHSTEETGSRPSPPADTSEQKHAREGIEGQHASHRSTW